MPSPSPKPTLVSACLAGLCTNWRGGADTVPWIRAMVARGDAVPVCPEQLGGLPTPRVPMERCGDRVLTSTGRDATAQMRQGAQRVLEIAQARGCETAILKSRSPSCGVGEVHDGSFSGALVKGDGVTAALLRECGLCVLSEEEVRSPADLA